MNIKELIKRDQLFTFLKDQGYTNLKYIPNRGVCGIQRMAFSVGLFEGLTFNSVKGRWCFPTMLEAKLALEYWDGVDDPTGNWIKYKGDIEYSNPKNITDET